MGKDLVGSGYSGVEECGDGVGVWGEVGETGFFCVHAVHVGISDVDCAVGGEAGEDVGKLVFQGREFDFDAVSAPEVGLVGVGAVGAAADDVAEGLGLLYEGQSDGSRRIANFQSAVYVEAD